MTNQNQNQNQIKSLAPVGPHVEGIIRFSYEEDAATSTQLPDFELLTRVHESTPETGQIPKMKTHPIADSLISRDSREEGHRLIKEVPIRFLGRSPESILSVNYQAFDTASGRLVCSGNGKDAIRKGVGASAGNVESCAGPESCAFAHQSGVQCKLHCRMRVQVDGSTDPLAVFEFQSSGINTYRTLSAKLNMLYAVFGNLRGLPFRLTSWAKSSPQSLFKPFFAANIELRDGLTFASTKLDEDDPFQGVGVEAMDRLENAMLLMAKNSEFDTAGAESVVTTWTPSSTLLGKRGAAVGPDTPVPAFTGLADVVQKARDSSRLATCDAKNTVVEPQTIEQGGEGEKISQVTTTAPSGTPAVDEVDESQSLCI